MFEPNYLFYNAVTEDLQSLGVPFLEEEAQKGLKVFTVVNDSLNLMFNDIIFEIGAVYFAVPSVILRQFYDIKIKGEEKLPAFLAFTDGYLVSEAEEDGVSVKTFIFKGVDIVTSAIRQHSNLIGETKEEEDFIKFLLWSIYWGDYVIDDKYVPSIGGDIATVYNILKLCENIVIENEINDDDAVIKENVAGLQLEGEIQEQEETTEE